MFLTEYSPFKVRLFVADKRTVNNFYQINNFKSFLKSVKNIEFLKNK